MKQEQICIPNKEIQNVHDAAGHEFICELRKTGQVLYGMFVELVRQHYKFDEKMLKGTPDVTWDEDPQKTDIWIDSELRWEDEHPEFRPAIFVRLDTVQYENQFGLRNSLGLVERTSEYRFSRLGKGSVTFCCIGTTAGETSMLLDETAEYLKMFSTQIADDLCFLSFSEVSRKSLQQSTKESKEKYMGTTTFSFSFEDTWSVIKETPVLKQIKFNSLHKAMDSAIISTDVRIPSLH